MSNNLNTSPINGAPFTEPSVDFTTDVFFGGPIDGAALNSVIINGRNFTPQDTEQQVFFGGQINGSGLNTVSINGRIIEVDSGPVMIDEFFGGLINGAGLNTHAINGRAKFETVISEEGIQGNITTEHRAIYEIITDERFYEHRSSYAILPPAVSLADHRAEYDIKIVGNVDFEHTAKYKITVAGFDSFEHRAFYNIIREGVSLIQHTAPYSMPPGGTFSADHNASYDIKITGENITDHRGVYRWILKGNFSDFHRGLYDVFLSDQTFEHTALYKTSAVSFVHESFYDIRGLSNFEHKTQYDILNFNPFITDHRSEYDMDKATFDHRAVFNYRVPFASDHKSKYDIIDFDPIAADHRAEYGMAAVTFDHRAVFNYLQTFASSHTSKYDIIDFEPVFADHRGLYDMDAIIFEHRGQYNIRENAPVEHRAIYNLTNAIATDHRTEYDIRDFNPVVMTHRAVYSIQEPVVIDITGKPVLTIEGETNPVEMVSVQIDRTELEVKWTCSVTLGNLADYHRFTPVTTFVIDLFGEEYLFAVDSKDLTRSDLVDRQAIIRGVSTSAYYDFPHIEPRDITHDTDATFLEVMDTILGGFTDIIPTGNPYLDFTIPAFRIGGSAISTLAFAVELAAKAGLVLESSKDTFREFIIRPLFPQDTTEYTLGSPAILETFNEVDNIFRVRESFVPTRELNRFRILDSQGTFQDRIEFELDDINPLWGYAKLYPSPFRTEGLVLEHVNTPEIAIYPDVAPFFIEDVDVDEGGELVQFSAGVGNLNRPIDSLTSVTWIGTSLGGVTFESGSTIIRSTDTSGLGYGLARVRYFTKYVRFFLVSINAEAIDLLLSVQD